MKLLSVLLITSGLVGADHNYIDITICHQGNCKTDTHEVPYCDIPSFAKALQDAATDGKYIEGDGIKFSCRKN